MRGGINSTRERPGHSLPEGRRRLDDAVSLHEPLKTIVIKTDEGILGATKGRRTVRLSRRVIETIIIAIDTSNDKDAARKAKSFQ